MARVAIESQAAPAAQGPLETQIQDLASFLIVACALSALANPAILVGAAAFWLWLWRYQPRLIIRIPLAVAFALLALVESSFIQWAWPWREWLSNYLPYDVRPVPSSQVWSSVPVEVILGPAWLETARLAARLRRRTVQAQVRRDHRLDKRRWRAISGRRQPMSPLAQRSMQGDSSAHPSGAIRLGIDAETNGSLDLNLPADLAAHVFLPGASGSGKTTTVARLADGALANGYGVVIVDAKAGSLGAVARKLADRYRVPFNLVDPDDPASLGYNPCSGDDASVANKLIGTFTFSAAGEIYKNIGMEAVPVVVRGLQGAGEPVTLQTLYAAFATRGMTTIAHKLPDDDPTGRRLLDLETAVNDDRTMRSGLTGLKHRLGALLEGKFGRLFQTDPTLDWDQALAAPSVTYVALSTLASSEDVELMGRVIAQDLKQTCARRLRRVAAGENVLPVLAIFDEFAALNEADQLADLLLQARQALMPVVISTQYLPETTSLRKACLGAGLIIAHRVEAEDAEAIAAQFGTRRATETTHQVDYETGFSEKGTIKRVDKYNVHPNELRNFMVGQAAIKSVPQQRYTIVRVFPDQ